MAEKFYEECAKQVQIIIGQHRKEMKDIGDAVTKVNTDKRYTPTGKEQLIQGLRAELKDLNKTKTDEIKAVVTDFCNQYQMIHNDDGKSDSQAVANALKVIEMCGYGLTTEVLRNAVEPLKDSYTSMKMISSMLRAKAGNYGVTYNSDVFDLMDEYMGINTELIAYEDIFESVRGVLDMPELVSAGIYGDPNYNGGFVNRLQDETRYSTLCLGDRMMEVGKMYDSASMKYPRLFK